MGRHLNTERWFATIRDGVSRPHMRRKRVSAAMEAQFPAKYREAYIKHGPARVVAMLRDERPEEGLAGAWERLKRMMNG